jgi:hypothetical protein
MHQMSSCSLSLNERPLFSDDNGLCLGFHLESCAIFAFVFSSAICSDL